MSLLTLHGYIVHVQNAPLIVRWGGSSRYSTGCGNYRWLVNVGESVALTFIGEGDLAMWQTAYTIVLGVSVTIDFRFCPEGAIGQISMDGVNVTQIDTYVQSADDCIPSLWQSATLAKGQHTVKVIMIGYNLSSTVPPDGIYFCMRNFMYVC